MTKPPTWQELRDAGRVLIDQPDRGLAIYPTTYGNVVICVMGDDGAPHLVPIQLSEIGEVANVLADSEARAIEAQEVLQKQESEIVAYHLIQRLKAGS